MSKNDIALTQLNEFFPKDEFKVENKNNVLIKISTRKEKKSNNTCAMLQIEDNDELQLGSLSKCGENSGTAILKQIIAFAKKNGYSKITLSNEAEITAPCENKSSFETKLTFVKLLEIGNTWYSQFGFESETSKDLEGTIKKIINNTFSNLLEKLNYVNKNNETEEKKNRDMIEKYKSKLGFEDQTVISEFIKKNMEHIKNKSSSVCNNIKELEQFIRFLCNSLSIIVSNNEIHGVDALIIEHFKDLTLDLKKSGGKIRMAKTIKRKTKVKKNKRQTKNYRKTN